MKKLSMLAATCRNPGFLPRLGSLGSLVSWTCLAALPCLLGCESGERHSEGPGARVEAPRIESPCAIFSEEIALGLGNGPYEPGREARAAGADLCLRMGGPGAPFHGATARFERMEREEFLARSCRSPQDPETGAPLYPFDTLAGIHLAACQFQPFGDGKVGLHVLTEDGWAVTVGGSTREKCLAAIEAMIPRLPKPEARSRAPDLRNRPVTGPGTRLAESVPDGATFSRL